MKKKCVYCVFLSSLADLGSQKPPCEKPETVGCWMIEVQEQLSSCSGQQPANQQARGKSTGLPDVLLLSCR